MLHIHLGIWSVRLVNLQSLPCPLWAGFQCCVMWYALKTLMCQKHSLLSVWGRLNPTPLKGKYKPLSLCWRVLTLFTEHCLCTVHTSHFLKGNGMPAREYILLSSLRWQFLQEYNSSSDLLCAFEFMFLPLCVQCINHHTQATVNFFFMRWCWYSSSGLFTAT